MTRVEKCCGHPTWAIHHDIRDMTVAWGCRMCGKVYGRDGFEVYLGWAKESWKGTMGLLGKSTASYKITYPDPYLVRPEVDNHGTRKEGWKCCLSCGKVKPAEEFHFRRGIGNQPLRKRRNPRESKDWRMPRCKACVNQDGTAVSPETWPGVKDAWKSIAEADKIEDRVEADRKRAINDAVTQKRRELEAERMNMILPADHKICKTCKQVKPFNKFSIRCNGDLTKAGSYESSCRYCRTLAKERSRMQINRDKKRGEQ